LADVTETAEKTQTGPLPAECSEKDESNEADTGEFWNAHNVLNFEYSSSTSDVSNYWAHRLLTVSLH